MIRPPWWKPNKGGLDRAILVALIGAAAVSGTWWLMTQMSSPTNQIARAAFRDSNGSIRVTTFPSATLSSASGVFGSDPSAADGLTGNLFVTARDNWNSYWLLSYTPGSGYGSWTPLYGIFSTDPVVTACGDGSIYLVGKDTWNSLWSDHYIPGRVFRASGSVEGSSRGSRRRRVGETMRCTWQRRTTGTRTGWRG
jgi:hypothetical protein